MQGLAKFSSEYKVARGWMLPVVLNLIKDVKGWESFSKSQNFSCHNFMSADSTTGADLWEKQHVCSAFTEEIHL